MAMSTGISWVEIIGIFVGCFITFLFGYMLYSMQELKSDGRTRGQNIYSKIEEQGKYIAAINNQQSKEISEKHTELIQTLYENFVSKSDCDRRHK